MKLLFASTNVNKVNEIRRIIPAGYTLLSLKDLDYEKELREDGETLQENALQKALFAWETFRIDCFSDDSGLEVAALENEPGVHSAHYAGLPRSNEKNIRLLLDRLHGKTNRSARFRTVIALIHKGKQHLFEGVLNGMISPEPAGEEGFGYDPVFIPDGYTCTLAEAGAEVKNRISHRRKAMDQLIHFLSAQAG
jgi:XTP/dITP diphosphohydrolase